MDDLKDLNNEFELFGVAFAEPWATLISVAAILVIGLITLKVILVLMRHWLKKTDHVDDMLNSFIVNVAKVAGIIVLIAMILDKLGVGIGTIVTVLGAAGAAIALALKDSLANVAGGLMIIITQPFKQGDLINVGEYRGRVQSIGLFLTTLRMLDYRIITIPNGLINTSVLVNESREEIRRVDMKISISYASDPKKAEAILVRVCREGELILDAPAPGIGVRRHDESGVVLDLMAWCRTDDYFNAGYYLKERVWQAFREEGIEIPFPQMEVRILEKDGEE